jgi:hypothetical protein
MDCNDEPELPADPDLDDVPAGLRDLHLTEANVLSEEGLERATIVIVPGLWGDARRRLEEE